MARRASRTAAVALALATLAGCVNPRGIEPAGRTLPIDEVAGAAAASASVTWPAQAWWEDFGDARLTSLVERALAGNPTLQVAGARLARASAYADYADANRKPQAGVFADATRDLYTANGIYPPPLGGSIGTNAHLFLTASWELDFFGRNRALLDSALGQERAAEADVQAARVLLASQVARAWFQLGWLVEDRDFARAILASRDRVRALVAERASAGLDSRADLRPIEGAAADARVQIEAAEERIALVRNVLAALTVQPPDAIAKLEPAALSRRAPAVPASVPVDLVGRRADVVAARLRVESSLRERDAAVAQFYPNVNLAGLFGLGTLGLGRLFEAASETWSVGPALRLPLFDAGRLRANLRGRTADVDGAIAAYNAVLADAVRESADQIAIARAIERQRAGQRASRAAAESALAFARERRAAGLSSSIAVLAAEIPALAQRRASAELAARAIDSEILLIRSLGGGYVEPAAPPRD